MPQIYTKEEIDVLLKEHDARLKGAFTAIQNLTDTIKSIRSRLNEVEVETQHSELLKAFHEHLEKTKKDNGTVSPYAR